MQIRSFLSPKNLFWLCFSLLLSIEILSAEYKPRIAIIGAGLSGLSAALELNRSGFPVMIFEARHESGGRVRTREVLDGKAFVEDGGCFINSNHEAIKSMIYELGLELVNVVDDGPVLYHQYIDGKKSTSKLNFLRFKDTLISLESDHTKLLANNKELSLRLKSLSIMEYLQQQKAEIEFIKLLRLMIHNGYGEDLEDMRADELFNVIDINIKKESFDLGGKFGDEKYVIKNGGRTLIKKLEESLTDPVKYSYELVTLEKIRNEYQLSFINEQKKQIYIFDKVILTLPPEVLLHLTCKNSIPPHIKEFIKQRHAGSNMKIFLYFKKPLWQKLECGNRFNFLCDRFSIWDNRDDIQDHKVFSLVAMVGGAEAKKASQQSINELENEILNALGVFMPKVRKFHIKTFTSPAWALEPYALGAYAGIIAPNTERVGQAFLEPYDKGLYFAGAALDKVHEGFMEGAIRSGQRAASWILNSN
jgi:monoamine oxidase